MRTNETGPVAQAAERNVPTPEGRALGAQLARLFKIERDNVEKQFPGSAQPCRSCAFVEGTFPNGCPETVMDALMCAVTGEPFFCHYDMKDGKPTKLCAGWATVQGKQASGLRRFIETQNPEHPIVVRARQRDKVVRP